MAVGRYTRFQRHTLLLSMPPGPITVWKICRATWASTAESGSSRRYTSHCAHNDLASEIRCFWPPDNVTPWHVSNLINHRLTLTLKGMHDLIYHVNYVILQETAMGQASQWMARRDTPKSIIILCIKCGERSSGWLAQGDGGFGKPAKW